MQLPKQVSSKAKIRFQDCDPFNHLNNANYISYFMNHREDQLIQHYDIDIYEMAQKAGISWVSSRNQIAYFQPALLMETVIIESQLFSYDSSQLKVEMRMYNEERSQLKSIIWSSFVHFNLLKQSRATHSSELIAMFESIVNPLQANTFEERLTQLKYQSKNLIKL